MGLKQPPLSHHISQRGLQVRQSKDSNLGPRLSSPEGASWLGLSLALLPFGCTSEAKTLRYLGEGIVIPGVSGLDQIWLNKQSAGIQRRVWTREKGGRAPRNSGKIEQWRSEPCIYAGTSVFDVSMLAN